MEVNQGTEAKLIRTHHQSITCLLDRRFKYSQATDPCLLSTSVLNIGMRQLILRVQLFCSGIC